MEIDQTRPANRSYRLRGVRITEAQQLAYENLWGKYGIDPEQDLDLNELFPNYKFRIAEIGTGMGEATAVIAKNSPDKGFLCFELHKPGLGSLLHRMQSNEIENIRIVADDARVFFERHLPDDSLDGIHLYFPDPWPKQKHWKRRIVQSETVTLFSKKLKSGGYMHIATDWVEYANWIMKEFSKNSSFIGGEIEKPDFRPLTKFESQGIRKGHKVTDLWYVKQ